VQDVRDVTKDDLDVVVGVCAAGFYDDPVMRWVFRDDGERLAQLRAVFATLGRDYLAGNGIVHVVGEHAVALWRDPEHGHDRITAERVASDTGETDEREADSAPPLAFAPDEFERLGILGASMLAAHPDERHWYLHVLSTVPERQGRGLGTRALAPVLARCDADSVPAYLESTNPRNVTLYERHGFVGTGEITLPDGPSLLQMWRDPR
jgi:ribosomal protein S18 acetylase RimI-like enzyme